MRLLPYNQTLIEKIQTVIKYHRIVGLVIKVWTENSVYFSVGGLKVQVNIVFWPYFSVFVGCALGCTKIMHFFEYQSYYLIQAVFLYDKSISVFRIKFRWRFPRREALFWSRVFNIRVLLLCRGWVSKIQWLLFILFIFLFLMS